MPERLLYLAGAASGSGDGTRLLAGLISYLRAQAQLDDAAELSYRAEPDGRPLAYGRVDTSRALDESIRDVAAAIGFHRRGMGPGARLHLLGWSLGGVMLFEAAVKLLDADPAWHGSFASIVTLSSPLNGCDVDGLDTLGFVAAGQAGRELCQRATDKIHRGLVGDRARRLRAAGVRLLTLGASGDVVVTPADSIVPMPGESIDRYVVSPRPRLGTDYSERGLGHGGILMDLTAWRMVLDTVAGS